MTDLLLRIQDLERRGVSGVGAGYLLRVLREARETIEESQAVRRGALARVEMLQGEVDALRAQLPREPDQDAIRRWVASC